MDNKLYPKGEGDHFCPNCNGSTFELHRVWGFGGLSSPYWEVTCVTCHKSFELQNHPKEREE